MNLSKYTAATNYWRKKRNKFIKDLGASSSYITVGYNNLLKKIEKLEQEIKKLGEKVDEIPDKIKSN